MCLLEEHGANLCDVRTDHRRESRESGAVLYFLSIDPIMIVFCIYVTLCIAAIAWRIFKEEII